MAQVCKIVASALILFFTRLSISPFFPTVTSVRRGLVHRQVIKKALNFTLTLRVNVTISISLVEKKIDINILQLKISDAVHFYCINMKLLHNSNLNFEYSYK